MSKRITCFELAFQKLSLIRFFSALLRSLDGVLSSVLVAFVVYLW